MVPRGSGTHTGRGLRRKVLYMLRVLLATPLTHIGADYAKRTMLRAILVIQHLFLQSPSPRNYIQFIN